MVSSGKVLALLALCATSIPTTVAKDVAFHLGKITRRGRCNRTDPEDHPVSEADVTPTTKPDGSPCPGKENSADVAEVAKKEKSGFFGDMTNILGAPKEEPGEKLPNPEELRFYKDVRAWLSKMGVCHVLNRDSMEASEGNGFKMFPGTVGLWTDGEGWNKICECDTTKMGSDGLAKSGKDCENAPFVPSGPNALSNGESTVANRYVSSGSIDDSQERQLNQYMINCNGYVERRMVKDNDGGKSALPTRRIDLTPSVAGAGKMASVSLTLGPMWIIDNPSETLSEQQLRQSVGTEHMKCLARVTAMGALGGSAIGGALSTIAGATAMVAGTDTTTLKHGGELGDKIMWPTLAFKEDYLFATTVAAA